MRLPPAPTHRYLAALALALSLFAGSTSHASEVNYLELAARLVADGHYGRAEGALRNINPAEDDIDLARYHTLQGLVALRSENTPRAIDSLNLALNVYRQREQDNPNPGEDPAKQRTRDRQRVHLYLAQAHMRENDFQRTIEQLDMAGDVGAAIAMVHELRAQAHWQLAEYGKAFDALRTGEQRFPDNTGFMRRKVFYLMDLGFYQQAAELGLVYLESAEADVDDFVAIGSALRRSGEYAAALRILERAGLRYPGERNIAIELSHTWLDQERIGAAADIFSNVVTHHPDLRLEAAELQRRAGRPYRALLINSAIDDQVDKHRQRLAILMAMERWDQAAAMEDALRRSGLLDNDQVRYAFAYALFKAGDYPAADRALTGISDSELFNKAADLRRAMERCSERRWQCI